MLKLLAATSAIVAIGAVATINSERSRSTSVTHETSDYTIGFQLGERSCAEPELARGLYNFATGPGSRRNAVAVRAGYYAAKTAKGCI